MNLTGTMNNNNDIFGIIEEERNLQDDEQLSLENSFGSVVDVGDNDDDDDKVVFKPSNFFKTAEDNNDDPPPPHIIVNDDADNNNNLFQQKSKKANTSSSSNAGRGGELKNGFVAGANTNANYYRQKKDEVDDDDEFGKPFFTNSDTEPTFVIHDANPLYKLFAASRLQKKENINDEVDQILSSKLNKLTLSEREQGGLELHGVTTSSNTKKETPEMIQGSLLEMEAYIAMTSELEPTTSDSMDLDNGGNPEAAVATTTTVTTTTTLTIGGKTTTTTKKTIKTIPNNAPSSPTANKVTAAYTMACQQDQSYVEYIKLLCLRADKFDVSKATKRLFGFFTQKLELFGLNKLTKDITIEDLKEIGDDDHDMEFGLSNGLFTLLQQRDTAGRAIIMFLGPIGSECSIETSLRIQYYVFMSALRDLEIQRNGIVVVLWSIGQTKFHSDRPGKLARYLKCLPARVSAMHVCLDRKIMDIALKILLQRLESVMLCRVRAHHGTYLETMYELMTFGIPRFVMPINDATGELDVSMHQRWIQMEHEREKYQKQKEVEANHHRTVSKSTSQDVNIKISADTPMSAVSTASITSDDNNNNNDGNSVVVVVPGPMDIILGHGASSRTCPGYIRMKNLIEEHYEEYEMAGRIQKVEIAKNILQLLNKEYACRFVRWTTQGLVMCTETESRDKISHAFRNMRRRKPSSSTAKNKGSNSSTTAKKKKNKQSDENIEKELSRSKRGRNSN